MKKLFTLFVIIALTISVFAQSPQKMSYQAVIRDAGNALVTSHAVGMRISILQGSESGTVVYTETQTPTTNANGLVSIEIGGGTGFDAINWAAGSYFLKTENDPIGGTNYTIVGTSQLLSVPYALYAKTAETSIDANDLRQQIKMLEDNLIAAGIYKLVDIEGNQYNVVTIGTQVWMKENLRTTKYRNGDLIGTTTPATLDITSETTPKYQWAYGGNESNVSTYGRLYTWFAVNDSRHVCPAGWHVPSNAEWITLTDYLTNNGYGFEGSGSDIAKSMAAKSGWSTNSTPGTVGNDQASNNSSGFTALPGGSRDDGNNFSAITYYGRWWSSTEGSASTAYARELYFDGSGVGSSGNFGKQGGFSVRCLKD